MHYRVKIQLTTPIMGSQATTEKIRRFRRGLLPDTITIEPDMWFWTLRQACQAIGGMEHFDVTTLRIPNGIVARTFSIYTHSYTREGRQLREQFESIRRGAQLTFDVSLTDLEPTATRRTEDRAVDEETMHKLITYIGTYLGLSPWGSKFNFGRFNVINFEKIIF